MRLDNYMIEKMLCATRSRASNLIKMGMVTVGGKVIKKAGFEVSDGAEVKLLCENFATLGSLKLQKAIEDFDFSCKGLVCADIGAGNGGFTDVLLINGAKRVYAIDVGRDALLEHLMRDIRVVNIENFNARYLEEDTLGEKVDLAVVDVSFISLTIMLPAVLKILKKSGEIIALIKPQFEASQKELTKDGIVKTQKLVERIVDKISAFCISMGLTVVGLTPVPDLFKEKNKEYLIYLRSR